MDLFYQEFYTATEHSLAHRLFCERVFGMDLCQHGFASLEQIELVGHVCGLSPGVQVLELGCGNGMIAEYLSDRSGAHITGLDNSAAAIEQARQRTAAKSDRLVFEVGDINQLALLPAALDVILSIDSVYFSQDYAALLGQLKAALRPGGQMAFLYSHGREPWVPIEQFQKESILPDGTPLAQALRANDLPYRTVDLTRQDYELALLRKEALRELKGQFAAEGSLFIYENRMGDALGISQAVVEGLHARYLVHVRMAG